MTAVTGSHTAAGSSASYVPLPTRNLDGHGCDFNVAVDFTTGAGVGTVVLERSPNAGTTWLAVSKPDFTDASFTASITFSVHEDSPDARYRLRCSAFTSGVISYWLGA